MTILCVSTAMVRISLFLMTPSWLVPSLSRFSWTPHRRHFDCSTGAELDNVSDAPRGSTLAELECEITRAFEPPERPLCAQFERAFAKRRSIPLEDRITDNQRLLTDALRG